MRLTLKGLLVAAAIAAPMMASANTLVGEWTGTGHDLLAGNGEAIDLYFLTQTADGSNFDVTGTVDVTCIPPFSDPKCGSGGTINFTGALAANDTLSVLWTGGTTGSFNVTADLNGMTGSVSNPARSFAADWSLSKVVPNTAPEMDATSGASGLALLVGGLLVLRGRRWRLSDR